jgi:hypothetical protein
MTVILGKNNSSLKSTGESRAITEVFEQKCNKYFDRLFRTFVENHDSSYLPKFNQNLTIKPGITLTLSVSN